MIGKVTLVAYLFAAVLMPLQAIACDMSMNAASDPGVMSPSMNKSPTMSMDTSHDMSDCHKEKTADTSKSSCSMDCTDCFLSVSSYTIEGQPVAVPNHQISTRLISTLLTPHDLKLLRPPIT